MLDGRIYENNVDLENLIREKQKFMDYLYIDLKEFCEKFKFYI
jgi:hypothetical protein